MRFVLQLVFVFCLLFYGTSSFARQKESERISSILSQNADKYLDGYFLTVEKQAALEKELEDISKIPLVPALSRTQIREICNKRVKQRTEARVKEKFPQSVEETVQKQLEEQYPLWKDKTHVTVHFKRGQGREVSIISGKLYQTKKDCINVKCVEIPYKNIVPNDRVHLDAQYNQQFKKEKMPELQAELVQRIERYAEQIAKEEKAKEFPSAFTEECIKAGYVKDGKRWITRKEFCNTWLAAYRREKEKQFWASLDRKGPEETCQILQEVSQLDLIESQKKRILQKLEDTRMPPERIISGAWAMPLEESLYHCLAYMKKNPKYIHTKGLCILVQSMLSQRLEVAGKETGMASWKKKFARANEVLSFEENFKAVLDQAKKGASGNRQVYYVTEKEALLNSCRQIRMDFIALTFKQANEKLNDDILQNKYNDAYDFCQNIRKWRKECPLSGEAKTKMEEFATLERRVHTTLLGEVSIKTLKMVEEKKYEEVAALLGPALKKFPYAERKVYNECESTYNIALITTDTLRLASIRDKFIEKFKEYKDQRGYVFEDSESPLSKAYFEFKQVYEKTPHAKQDIRSEAKRIVDTGCLGYNVTAVQKKWVEEEARIPVLHHSLEMFPDAEQKVIDAAKLTYSTLERAERLAEEKEQLLREQQRRREGLQREQRRRREGASTIVCPACNGQGRIASSGFTPGAASIAGVQQTCATCRGSGRVRADADITDCPYCGGRGNIRNTFNGHPMQCEHCGGSGKRER